MRCIGNDASNLFNAKDSNINNIYIYPLGITLTLSGNHSQLSSLLKCELKQIKVNGIYDISEELLKDNNGLFTNFYGSSKGNIPIEKWRSIMEIGKHLLKCKYKEFPTAIKKRMEEKDSDDSVNSMTYKDKVLIEFSNTAYLRVTGAVNFDNVPSEIWNLWYDDSGCSVQSLSKANADDSKWKTLYEKLKKEFDKLK